MKKIVTAILSLALLGAAALPVFASERNLPIAPAPTQKEDAFSAGDERPMGFTIEIDGKAVEARACVMVPLRAIAEQLGFTVAWDNGTITVTGSERYAELTIGADWYFAAPTQEGMMGANLFQLGCAPFVSNGTTYVPVELFDALLGCNEGAVVLEGDTVRINTSAQVKVQIPNPFTDHASLSEAAKAVGFSMTAPDYLEGYPQRTIQTLDNEMIQVSYQNDESSIIVRKAVGGEDISGDYNQYSQAKTERVNGLAVTMKGENNRVMVAIWTDNGYTYAITADAGMSAADMAALIQAVK